MAKEEPCIPLGKVTVDKSVPCILNKILKLAESVSSRAQKYVFCLADRAGVGCDLQINTEGL